MRRTRSPSRHLPFSLVVLLLLGGPAAARDTEAPTGAAPSKNFSNIHDEADWIVKAFASAAADAKKSDWPSAVRTLQTVVDARKSRASPTDAAPYVRAVYGSSVYEGAWIVAHHTIVRGGDEAVAAYEREYGAAAKALLDRAAMRRDTGLLRSVAARFLPTQAGRRTALLLADLALERADFDTALEWIEALEDLESVSGESKDALAPWRAARVRRHAVALARDTKSIPLVAKALAVARPVEGASLDAVPPHLRRPEIHGTGWLTTGGNAARAALPASLGSEFRLAWFRAPSTDDDLTDARDPQRREHDRPSLWLPPRAAATEKHLFVSDGQYLHIYDLATGARLFERDETEYAGMREGGVGEDGDVDRRLRFGLLEGHTLSLHPVRHFRRPAADGTIEDLGAGHLVLAAVPDGDKWSWDRSRSSGPTRRDDHIQAYHWNGERLAYLWRVGGATSRDKASDRAFRGGLPNDTRLYGAPLVYRGRMWVAGVRPAKATQDRWEVWLYAFDPVTGQVATRTHLGTGTPMRSGRMDEVIPSSPAASHGRVVVSTSLGIIAAVDAADGRMRWIHRYDRSVETERGRRRNRDARDRGLRTTSFVNEPPILALDRCYVTPTDSNVVLSTFNRPVRRNRRLVVRARDRYDAGAWFMPEQIAGVAPGGPTWPPSIVLVGKGESGSLPGPMVVVHHALGDDQVWPQDAERPLRAKELWTGGSPTGFGPEPYGRALVTEAEIFVPQADGIAIYELFDRDANGSHFLGLLNRDDMDTATAKQAPPRPFGNLIPIPGQGIVAVSATTVAFWKRK